MTPPKTSLVAHWTEEELRAADSQTRDYLFADTLLWQFRLMAQHHPEAVRAALENVYPAKWIKPRLRELEGHATRLHELVETIRKYAVQAKELMDEVNDTLDGIQQRLDELEYVTEKLERQ